MFLLMLVFGTALIPLPFPPASAVQTAQTVTTQRLEALNSQSIQPTSEPVVEPSTVLTTAGIASSAPQPSTAVQPNPSSAPQPSTAVQPNPSSAPQLSTAVQPNPSSAPQPLTAVQPNTSSAPQPSTAVQPNPSSAPQPLTAVQPNTSSAPQLSTALQPIASSAPQPPTALRPIASSAPQPSTAVQPNPSSAPQPSTALRPIETPGSHSVGLVVPKQLTTPQSPVVTVSESELPTAVLSSKRMSMRPPAVSPTTRKASPYPQSSEPPFLRAQNIPTVTEQARNPESSTKPSPPALIETLMPASSKVNTKKVSWLSITVIAFLGVFFIAVSSCMIWYAGHQRRSRKETLGSRSKNGGSRKCKKDDAWAGPVRLGGQKDGDGDGDEGDGDGDEGEDGMLAGEGDVKETDQKGIVLKTFTPKAEAKGVGAEGSKEAQKWAQTAPLLFIDEGGGDDDEEQSHHC